MAFDEIAPVVDRSTAAKKPASRERQRRHAVTSLRRGAERSFATTKDPATTISRGWCRLMGLTPLMLFVTTLLIARNQRILAAWNTRQEETAHRAARGLPPRTRRRRRKTPAALTATSPP